MTSFYGAARTTEATLEVRALLEGLAAGEGEMLEGLHRIQHHYGYMPRAAIPAVAQHFRIPEARVYGAITFYSEFRETPPAETTISWCSGPACFIKGGENIELVLENMLGCAMGENTADNKLGLHLGQCNGTCDNAPQVWVNGKVVGPLTRGRRRWNSSESSGRRHSSRCLPLRAGAGSPTSCLPTQNYSSKPPAPGAVSKHATQTRIAVCDRHLQHRNRRPRDPAGAAKDEVARRNIDVDVDQVGGNGLSFANPVVLVRSRASPAARALQSYQDVTAADVPAFVDSVLVTSEDYDRWTARRPARRPGAHVPDMGDHPWWSMQSRRLMQDMGDVDPENIDECIARGAYAGLERALDHDARKRSSPRSSAPRSAAAAASYFPTGRKWDFLRTSPTTPKYMVCNADEGDPGAWVNRMTLESDPHALIEGMMIGGWAAGADHGYIYIREEYPLAFERMRQGGRAGLRAAACSARTSSGAASSFDIEVVRGAGSYVCGEESGLIASIEDGRGMPKIRPPFPAASGVFGEGTNVNNVESYHTRRLGPALRAREVDKRSAPSATRARRCSALSGDVQRVGCFELPFGTPLRDCLRCAAAACPTAGAVKAMQPGGPLDRHHAGLLPRPRPGAGVVPREQARLASAAAASSSWTTAPASSTSARSSSGSSRTSPAAAAPPATAAPSA